MPFIAGVVWIAAQLVLVSVHGAHPYEWWFGTMPDLQVWAILIALGPVACLGGALLGVLTGRWLRFPGAPAVMVVAVIAIDMVGQMVFVDGSSSELRLWVPWAMFHGGAEDDGTAILFAGSAAFYLVYLLCLCAAAGLVAVWHDRTARTARLRAAIAGVVVIGLAALALAMTTGNDTNETSKPVPYKVND